MAHKHSVWVKTMSCVIDLASRRPEANASTSLFHPAGVKLPFDKVSDAELITPEIRQAIHSASYSAETIQLLPDLVEPGDRVLVIGAGLGVVSTLIAKSRGIERVLALEANTALVPYLQRVHALNGVPSVEVVNGIPAVGANGRAPFFARRDVRASSQLPEDGDWQHAMLVPLVDLDLIISEEAVNLIICEIPMTSAHVLAEADLGAVEHISITPSFPAEADALPTLLAEKGFATVRAGMTLLLDRDGSRLGRSSESTVLTRTGT